MVAAVLFLAVLPLPARAQRAVYLVRHADKANNDPDTPLSTKGIERAEALAALLEHAGVKAVYTSQFRRSKETAAPLATKLGLNPQVVTDGNPGKTLEKIRQDHPDGIVLVVGHSDTIPELLKALAPESAVTIGPAEFDRIFVAVPIGPDKTGWTAFRYGAPSITP